MGSNSSPPGPLRAAPLRRRVLSWLPAALVMGAIFWLSSVPGDELPLPDFRFSDKLAHFLAYAFLGFLIGLRRILREPGIMAVWNGGRDLPFREAPDLSGLAIGILYGMSDEIHQLFVPMRQFAVGDLVADALGAAAGIGILAVVEKRRTLISAG